jgi:hypothetical protein
MQYFRLPPHWQMLVDTDHLITSDFSTPFYYVDRPRWLPHLSDQSLTLLAPIATYWTIILLYLLFLFVHSPKGKHHALRGQTVRLVLEIQFVQTVFGWLWLTRYGSRRAPHEHVKEMRAIGRHLGVMLPTLLGKANAQEFLNRNGKELIHFTYWWAIPVARQFVASQVFSHRITLTPFMLIPLCDLGSSLMHGRLSFVSSTSTVIFTPMSMHFCSTLLASVW